MEIKTIQQQSIESKIFTIRGVQVMLDCDLAESYDFEIRALNQVVKRNIDRFPQVFMFQLTQQEVDSLRSQIVILDVGNSKYENGFCVE